MDAFEGENSNGTIKNRYRNIVSLSLPSLAPYTKSRQIRTELPNQFTNFKNLKKAYLFGNRVGSNGWLDHANNAIVNLFEKDKIAKCEMQCSPFCTDDTQNYMKACIPSCNSHSCNFQNGACQVD